MRKEIRIGTRASLLAVTQSTMIKELIEKQHPGTSVELVKIMTTGDKILDVPLAKVGGKGLFVKELEEALLDGRADLAVHSMKDVPTDLPEGLHLGVVTERENPRDAFVSNKYATVLELPQGATVGTSSLRRKSQLAAMRPDLVIKDLRGNVDTRLRKLDEGMYDAIILASAGLNRLGKSGRITSFIEPAQMVPAIGQGALGLELRVDDTDLQDGISFLNHHPTAVAVTAERAFLFRLEGGCQVPIGAFATAEGDTVSLTGLIASIDGREIIKEQVSGPSGNAAEMGTRLAEKLLDMGGREILEEVYGS